MSNWEDGTLITKIRKGRRELGFVGKEEKCSSFDILKMIIIFLKIFKFLFLILERGEVGRKRGRETLL